MAGMFEVRGSWAFRWVALLFAVFVLVACGGAGSGARAKDGSDQTASPAGERSLAQRVAAEIERIRPGTRVEVLGPLDLKVHTEQELQVNLANLQAECEQMPDSCDERVARFSQIVVSGPPGKLTAESLMAVLKTANWLAQMEAKLAEKGQSTKLVSFPLAGDLRVVLVQDSPLMTRPLEDSDLAELGLSGEQALSRALENLKQAAGGFKLAEPKPGMGLYAMALANGYDASMMILHSEWPALQSRVQGDIVVAPIGRDILLVTGSGNTEALKMLTQVLEAEKRDPGAAYPITTELYRWTPEGWQPFRAE